jgi:hypothetical protein
MENLGVATSAMDADVDVPSGHSGGVELSSHEGSPYEGAAGQRTDDNSSNDDAEETPLPVCSSIDDEVEGKAGLALSSNLDVRNDALGKGSHVVNATRTTAYDHRPLCSSVDEANPLRPLSSDL